MRGRKRKPAVLRQAQGNPSKRPIPAEPEFEHELPPPPHYLNAAGLEEWNRLALKATELGVTTAENWTTLVSYCFDWQRVVEFSEALVKFKPGTVQRARLESGYDKAHKQLMKDIVELGFSPVTRSKVDLRKMEKVRDPFEVFEGGKAQKG